MKLADGAMASADLQQTAARSLQQLIDSDSVWKDGEQICPSALCCHLATLTSLCLLSTLEGTELRLSLKRSVCVWVGVVVVMVGGGGLRQRWRNEGRGMGG